MRTEFEIKLNRKQITLLAISTSLLYGLILYFFNIGQSISVIVVQSIIYGLLMTLFFVFLFPRLLKKLIGKRVDNIKPHLLENEKVEREIFANLFKGIEGVGGKVFLTNERLIFKSHSLNIQRGQTSIVYSDIKSVTKRKTAKLIDNGIKVTTTKGKEYSFVLEDRDVELKNIQDKLTS